MKSTLLTRRIFVLSSCCGMFFETAASESAYARSRGHRQVKVASKVFLDRLYARIVEKLELAAFEPAEDGRPILTDYSVDAALALASAQKTIANAAGVSQALSVADQLAAKWLSRKHPEVQVKVSLARNRLGDKQAVAEGVAAVKSFLTSASSPDAKIRAHCALAQLYSGKGDKSAAISELRSARTVVAEFLQFQEKLPYLFLIAQTQASAGDSNGAAACFSTAMEMAPKVSADSLSWVLTEAGKVLPALKKINPSAVTPIMDSLKSQVKEESAYMKRLGGIWIRLVHEIGLDAEAVERLSVWKAVPMAVPTNGRDDEWVKECTKIGLDEVLVNDTKGARKTADTLVELQRIYNEDTGRRTPSDDIFGRGPARRTGIFLYKTPAYAAATIYFGIQDFESANKAIASVTPRTGLSSVQAFEALLYGLRIALEKKMQPEAATLAQRLRTITVPGTLFLNEEPRGHAIAIAWIYSRAGDEKEGLRWANFVAGPASRDDSATILTATYALIGEAYARAGKVEDANNCFDKAVSAAPGRVITPAFNPGLNLGYINADVMAAEAIGGSARVQ